MVKTTSLPVLNTIKLERTAEGWITLTATDRDHFATVRLEQPTDGEPETLLVRYDALQKTVKSCGKDEQILIERAGAHEVSIKYAIGSQYAEHKVETCPVEEFSEIPQIKGEPIPLPDSLRDSIHQAFECASTDETRLLLNGAYLDVGGEECHQVVGTDGRHLFSSNSFKLPLKKGVIVPSHRVLQWKEFNKDGEWQLEIAPGTEEDSPDRLQISSRRWKFITSAIDGNYPNWRQVVPGSSEMKTLIEIDPGAVEQVVQIIARMPCHDSPNFIIGLEVTGNKVQLLGRDQTAEHWTKVEVPTARVTGIPMRIFLNRNFLNKALRFGLTRIELINPMSPLRFSNGGRQMIVMPTRSEAVPPPATPTTTTTSVPEESGAGVAEPVNSGTDPQPTPTATTNERSTTVQQDTNTTGESTSPTPQSNTTKIHDALELIDALKDSFQDNIVALKDLSGKLKAVQKEQKATEREFHSIRTTLRSLQSVKL